MASVLETKLEKLIKGEVKYQAVNFGLNLLISRMQRVYQANPTPDEMENCLKQMNDFLRKYQNVMAKEVEAIENL